LLGTPELPDAPARIYLDVEGLPDEGFVYLIGMTVVREGAEEHHAFWADTKDQERDIFDQFLTHLSRYSDHRVYCYGGYERAFLKRMRKTAPRKGPVDRVLAGLVNVLSAVYAHVYFPCYSNGLKDVAGCLGFHWTDPESSGVQSIVWRKRWEDGRPDGWRSKIETYNREDCAALRRVTEFLFATGIPQVAPGGPGPMGGPQLAVASVEELDRLGAVSRRGKIEFFHPDFAHINGCGRFDYQRERVYLRAGKRRRRKEKKVRRWVNRGLRVSRKIQIVARTCPSCGGSYVTQWAHGKRILGQSTKHKKSFDLVFTTGAIKRKVIECRTCIHECRGCGATFTPDRYRRLAKHFHGLKSWVTYEYVAHRVPCPAKDRPRHAGELAAALTAYLESVEARLRRAELERAAAEVQAREERKRRRVQLALVSAVVLMLLGGGAFAWWADHQATERQVAEERIKEEGQRQRNEIENRRRTEAGRPLVFNQIAGGKSPPCSLSQLQEFGVSVVIYSTPCLFAAQHAMERTMQELQSSDGYLPAPGEDGVGVKKCTALMNDNLASKSAPARLHLNGRPPTNGSGEILDARAGAL
jgi:hypothetical protein